MQAVCSWSSRVHTVTTQVYCWDNSDDDDHAPDDIHGIADEDDDNDNDDPSFGELKRARKPLHPFDFNFSFVSFFLQFYFFLVMRRMMMLLMMTSLIA